MFEHLFLLFPNTCAMLFSSNVFTQHRRFATWAFGRGKARLAHLYSRTRASWSLIQTDIV
jgi:hypothetical protein